MDNEQRNTPSRNRKPPNRYGILSNEKNISDKDDVEDELLFDLYSDDSMEDKTYTPETPRRTQRVITVKRSKKSVHFSDKLQSKDLDQIEITGFNFDSMCDNIDGKNISIVSDPNESREENELNSITNQVGTTVSRKSEKRKNHHDGRLNVDPHSKRLAMEVHGQINLNQDEDFDEISNALEQSIQTSEPVNHGQSSIGADKCSNTAKITHIDVNDKCHGNQDIGIENTSSTRVSSSKFKNAQVPKNVDDVYSICQLLLDRFEAFSKESFARISIIEDALFINGSVPIINQKSNLVIKIEESNSFITSNNLPIQERKHLDAFEADLKNGEFKRIAVNHICDYKNNIAFLYTVYCTLIL